jgi:hypothetical protein
MYFYFKKKSENVERGDETSHEVNIVVNEEVNVAVNVVPVRGRPKLIKRQDDERGGECGDN